MKEITNDLRMELKEHFGSVAQIENVAYSRTDSDYWINKYMASSKRPSAWCNWNDYISCFIFLIHTYRLVILFLCRFRCFIGIIKKINSFSFLFSFN